MKRFTLTKNSAIFKKVPEKPLYLRKDRIEITDSCITVRDKKGTIRVKIGIW